MRNLWVIFWTSLKLGFTSFGGPAAHLGYFQQIYVKQKKWLTDEQYLDLLALSQFLPGPASSQVGMGIGLRKGGITGSIAAFIGFTLPSVMMLIIFVYIMERFQFSIGWLQGLKIVAVAIVAQAILDMGKKILKTPMQYALLVLVAILLLYATSIYSQIGVLIGSAMIGYLFFKQPGQVIPSVVFSKKWGAVFLSAFFVLLLGLPIAAQTLKWEWLVLFEKFYLAGSLVFGGGHVVLPLLESQFVGSYVTAEDFLAGYGLTQAVPGPLFTFASYLGMVIGGIPIAILATVAIFLPAFLLIVGAYPFWSSISSHQALRGAVAGMNVAVIGILIAAFISPIITSTIYDVMDAFWAIVLFVLLVKFKIKPWNIVLIGVLIGFTFYR
ncbi:ChrA protein [Solibacillus sp. R5-41]|uniref:chromate efflux transporter n=1 Tax=Solibacillus sp. R5-41 TaxID=2048654 RepID=UPI000C128197|nr:chromate efflux transporter [Solibacillus sp. R5-41]ATP41283.1 ChrA protein [Solibacillus sp. R5-41]